MVMMKVNVTDNEYSLIRSAAGKDLTISQYCRLKIGLPIVLPENDSFADFIEAVKIDGGFDKVE